MGDELRSRNNLSDLPDRAVALTNLGVTATTVTVATTAGANNESVITVTVKNASGTTVAAVHRLDLWFSADATGVGLTATAYSGSLVATVGSLLTTLTAKKHFTIVTAATGIFTGTLTDSAETADFCAVAKPLTGAAVVSSALVFG